MRIYLRSKPFNPIPLYTLVEVASENPAGRIRGYVANIEEYNHHRYNALYKITLDPEVVYELQRLQYIEKEDVSKHQMTVRSKLLGAYTLDDLRIIVDAKEVVAWQKEHGINIWERPSYGCNEMRVRHALDIKQKRSLEKQHFSGKQVYLNMPRTFMRYSQAEADKPKIIEHPFDFTVENNEIFWVNQAKNAELKGADLLTALWSDVKILSDMSLAWADREIRLTKRKSELREYVKTQMMLLFIMWITKVGDYECTKGTLKEIDFNEYWLNFVDHQIDVKELDADWLVCEPCGVVEDLFKDLAEC